MSAPTEAAALKRTPLYSLHRELGAKLIDFGGWEMPVQYSGILEEHRAVRERAGIFDVSHMGELEVRGPGALAALQSLTPNDVAKLADGRTATKDLYRTTQAEELAKLGGIGAGRLKDAALLLDSLVLDASFADFLTPAAYRLLE